MPEIAWWTRVGLMIGAALVLHIVIAALAGRKRVGKFGVYLKAASAPLYFTIWSIAFTYTFELLLEIDLPLNLPQLPTTKARGAILVAGGAWLALRINKAAQKQGDGATPYKAMREEEGGQSMISRLITPIIIGVELLLIIQVLGVDIGGLLAFGGFGALTIGIAGKELFANWFGGRMLCITQPFREGETIEVPTQKIEGEVVDIGWYQSKLHDPTGAPLFVPNSIFAQNFIVNHSRARKQLFQQSFKLLTDEPRKAEEFMGALGDFFAKEDLLDSRPPFQVWVSHIEPGIVTIQLKGYIKSKKGKQQSAAVTATLFHAQEVATNIGAQLKT